MLGDTLVALPPALWGSPVEVQNYIDDTGVQVADVVVGLIDIRGLDAAAVEAIPEPFDYYCWDLYAQVGKWYEEEVERKERRQQVLRLMEDGGNPTAEIGAVVARRVVRAHLRTAQRLDVDYDLLAWEGDILRLGLWAKTFDRLQQTDTVVLAEDGKNAGCWIMSLAETEGFKGMEDADKVLVRSNGVATYVAKDIAYQMWKFGLSSVDFRYAPANSDSHRALWTTTSEGSAAPPRPFGRAARVYNVIDVRQSYLQKVVASGLEALGFPREAENSVHYSYEMVALTPRCIEQLGVVLDAADRGRAYVEMSGRKGLGIKADDLFERLSSLARKEVAGRHPEQDDAEIDAIAGAIALGAIRYFMLRFGRNKVVAFDFEEALKFQGETGPYLQNSVVRCRSIFRKLEADGGPTAAATRALDPVVELADLAEVEREDEAWDLVHHLARLDEVMLVAVETLELSVLAKWAFHSLRRLRREGFRHCGFHGDALGAGVFLPGGPVDEEPGRGQIRSHAGELLLHELKFGQRLPELATSGRVRECLIQSATRHAAGGGPHGRPQAIQRREPELESFALFAQATARRDAATLERDFAQGMGRRKDLRADEDESRGVRGDDKARDALAPGRRVGRCKHRVEVRQSRIGNERLAPVEDVVVPVAASGGGEGRDVGAGVGFGHREGGHSGAGHRAFEPGLAQCRGAGEDDGRGPQRLQREDGVGQRGRGRERLPNQTAGAKILLRNEPKPIVLTEKLDNLARAEASHRVVLGGRLWRDLARREPADPLRELEMTIVEKGANGFRLGHSFPHSKRGDRFSWKASNASRKFGPCIKAACTSPSCSNAASMSIPASRFKASFVTSRAAEGPVASFSARARASPTASFTTRWYRPIRCASAASMKSPVIKRCVACPVPTIRGRSHVAPMSAPDRPTLVKRNAIFADSPRYENRTRSRSPHLPPRRCRSRPQPPAAGTAGSRARDRTSIA